MHDIWNPWHGCVKCSEGCEHCYMYFLDAQRGQDGARVYRTKAGFDYPVQRDRTGAYRVKSGEMLRVCMTSDFFLEEADAWRAEAWDLMWRRPDVKFFLLTKRPERVAACLPSDWGDGWDHVMLNVSCENQRRADERIPLLHELPFKHKGVMCAPLIGPVDLAPYLAQGQIEQVICGGENYDGARPCDFAWVKALRAACEARDVSFCFIETGTNFVKDGKRYWMPSKRLQSTMAHKSGMSRPGKPLEWRLADPFWGELAPEELYVPRWRTCCDSCGSRPICNGCSNCGSCDR
jgi:protein gp37